MIFKIDWCGNYKNILKIPKNPQFEEGQTMQWPKEKRQKQKQWSTKHYTEDEKSRNTNPTKTWGWTQLLRNSRYFLLHMSRPSCWSYNVRYSCRHLRTFVQLRLREMLATDVRI